MIWRIDPLIYVFYLIGNMQSANYIPEDVFWGELGGCLEALDAGTTTLVDHAHINISPAHCEASPLSIVKNEFY